MFKSSKTDRILGTLSLLMVFAPAAPTLAQSSGSASNSTQKTTWVATLKTLPSDNPIVGLEYTERALPVQMIARNGKLRPFVELKGSYTNPGWSLFVVSGSNEKPVPLKDDAKFQFFAILTSQNSDVTFVARGPDGATQTSYLQVYSPEAQEFQIGSDIGEFTIGMGGGSFSYFQSGFGRFSSKNAVQELGYRTPNFLRHYVVSLSGRAPLWTVSSAPIKASPDLIRAKMELSYTGWQIPARSLTFDISLGVAYLNLISYDAPFGFNSLYSPNLGFGLTRKMSEGAEAQLFAAYSPLSGVLKLESVWEARLGYKLRLPNLHHIRFDLSFLRFSYSPVELATVAGNLLALTASYSF